MNPKLEALEKAIRGKPKTAKELVEQLGWSKPTVYRMIILLEEEGVTVRRSFREQAGTGPQAVEYQVSE